MVIGSYISILEILYIKMWKLKQHLEENLQA